MGKRQAQEPRIVNREDASGFERGGRGRALDIGVIDGMTELELEANTKKTPRVSVVMPSYNHAPFIGKAIESVLEQSFADFELIIVDDGSADGTQEVARLYTDSRIRLKEFAANRGACEAMNRCITLASGEYIAVAGSDDCFLPGKLARQVAILDSEPALAAVFGLPEFIDEDGAAIPAEKNPLAGLFSTEPPNRFAWLRRFFFDGNALCHSTVMIRKRIYEELGMYDVALRQLPDFDMWVRVCARYTIRVLPEPLTAFRVLNGLRNTSAPTPVAMRRHVWEHGRVLRRYWTMDEATLQRAFGADIPQEIAERGLPMAEQLAMTVATRGLQQGYQIFALETLEAAVARGASGVSPHDLHRLSGELDPFRVTVLQNMMLQQQESSVAREHMQERAASVERERDEALLRVCELEQAEQLLRLDLQNARADLDVERQAVAAIREAHAQEVQARMRADAHSSLQAKLRAGALANLSTETEHFQKTVHELEAHVEELQAFVHDLHQSASWRFTRPIRLAAIFLRKRMDRLRNGATNGASPTQAYSSTEAG